MNKYQVKIIKINGLNKTTSSSGRWVVLFDFVYPTGLKANYNEYFWFKQEAVSYLNTLKIGQEITI